MVLDRATAEQLARELDEAESTRVQLEHFSKRVPGLSIDDGYEIQRIWVAMKKAAGRSLRGHKIGLTSRAMQQASQISEPDYGSLLDDMFFADGGDIPVERFIRPRVEVELAFFLSRRLQGPGVSILDVLRATEYITPALEIIDARIEQLCRRTKTMRSVVDTISDNAANAGVVVGGRPVRPDAIDLRWCGALLHKNAVIEETGVAAGVLNNPATGVAWLANKLAGHEEFLEAGELVLAGSFTRPVPGCAGDTFHADYGPLGSIAFRFA